MPYDTTVKSVTAKKKKKDVKLLVSRRFGQRQNNTAKRSAERHSFLSLLSSRGGNDFLQRADPEAVVTPPEARTSPQDCQEYPDKDGNAASGNH